MDVIKSLYDILDDYFFEISGTVNTFSLKDGTYYEGFVFQLLDDSLTFFLRGPLAPDEPIEIKLNDIDLTSLCHYSESEHKWKSAAWDVDKEIWIVTDYTRIKID